MTDRPWISKLVVALAVSCQIGVGFAGPVLAQGEAETPVVDAGAGAGEESGEGENLTIENVTVEGNRLVPSDDILKVVKTRRGDRFDRDQVMRDLKAVNNMGYFDDRSLQVVPEKIGSGVLLKIRVTENAPVTNFGFQGNSVMPTDELSKLFADQLGKPQNLTQLSQSIDKVEQAYHEKGYMLARVVDVKDDPDGSVSIKLDEGVIDSVKIVGNKKTKDFIIRNAIKAKAGTVYNEKQLTADLRKLYANGYFQDVRRSLTPDPEHPDKYTLKVEVDEKRTGSVGLGGGVDTIAGPFGSFNFSDSNFRGRGQVVSFSSQLGSGMMGRMANDINNGGNQFMPTGKTYQVEATFIEPNIKGTNTSMALSSFGRNFGSMIVDDASQRTLGASATFTKPLKRNMTAQLSFTGEQTALSSVSNFLTTSAGQQLSQNLMRNGSAATMAGAEAMAANIRRQQLEGGLYMTVSPTLFRDTREDVFDPHTGSYAKVTAGPSIGLNGGFVKAGASYSKYVPVTKETTLAVNMQGGSGFGGLPQFQGYRLGGWNGIRGYRSFSDLGTGSGMLMASAELRRKLPLPKPQAGSSMAGVLRFFDKNVRGAAFCDAGGVSGNTFINNAYNRSALGASVGIGLRVKVPAIGVVRLDYGFPLISTAMGRLTPRFTLGFGDRF